MSHKKFTPAIVRDDFFLTFSNPSNYNDLTIKNNNISKQLLEIYNNNIWNLKEQSIALNKKLEYNKMYDSWMNNIYLLDYKRKPKITTILKDDFYNFDYQGDNTKRTETTYINVYKSWINNIFINQKNSNTMEWFIINQSEVLLKLLEYRNKNNQSLETLRKDINLLLKFLKIATGERSEIVKKYKCLQASLSKMSETSEKQNILNEQELKSFVPYQELLKIRQKLYNEWENNYENTALNKYKKPLLRIQNIKSLLLSMYTLLPPMRNEIMNLEVVTSEKEGQTKKAAIFIKDSKNIFLYFNEKKKAHKPISFNINDPVIKSYSKENVDLLINNIIESLLEYPRLFLFINSTNDKYTEKGLQKMLYELLNDKNIGVNSLRSSYVSYYLDKVNKNQLDRIAFIMRTSTQMLYNNYFKAVDNTPIKLSNERPPTPPPPLIKIIKLVTPTPAIIKKLTDDERKNKQQARAQYLHDYYNNKKDVLLTKARANDKKNYDSRMCRELNQGKLLFKTIRPSTIEKYKIKFNDKTNLYYIDK